MYTVTPRERVFTLAGIMVALLLGALDQTIVATAMPRILQELNGLSLYTWVVTAYLLASTAMIPIYGKLSDLYGRKVVILTAMALFLAGSALSRQSRSMTELIVFRAVQGLGSAGIFSTAFTVVADIFAPAERGRYQGLFGAAAFLLVERRAAEPILPFDLLHNRTYYLIGNAAALLIAGVAFFGAILFLPVYMVMVVGVAASVAGLTIMPMTVSMVLSSFLSGQLVSRIGKYRVVLLGGAVVLAAGYFLMQGLTTETTRLAVTWRMIVLGIGRGPALPRTPLPSRTR
jgi:MFS family permease